MKYKQNMVVMMTTQQRDNTHVLPAMLLQESNYTGVHTPGGVPHNTFIRAASRHPGGNRVLTATGGLGGGGVAARCTTEGRACKR